MPQQMENLNRSELITCLKNIYYTLVTIYFVLTELQKNIYLF